MHGRSLTAILLFGVSTLALVAPAAAQTAPETVAQEVNGPDGEDDFGTIIVTATKRASTIQDVPFSINAQTQEDIQRANASTIEDISRNVAGLTVQNLGPGQSQVSVRGALPIAAISSRRAARHRRCRSARLSPICNKAEAKPHPPFASQHDRSFSPRYQLGDSPCTDVR